MIEDVLRVLVEETVRKEFESFKQDLLKTLSEKPASVVNPDDVILPDRFYNVDEAARLLKISKSKLYHDICKNRIRYSKTGKSVRFKGEYLLEYMEGNYGRRKWKTSPRGTK